MQIAISTQLWSAELAKVGVVASDQVGVNLALTIPRFERVQIGESSWVAHPLNRLVVGHEIDILLCDKLIDEAKEDLQVLLLFEPSRVEVDTEWRPIGLVVAVEVVHEQVKNFFVREMRRTGIDHRTSVTFDVERIHDHLPHTGERPRWALLSRALALVWDTEIEGVRPERWICFWSDERGIVGESKLLHHNELGVPARTQKRHTSSANIIERDARKLVDDVSHSGELIEPIFDGRIERPPQFGLPMGDRVSCDFVAVVPELLNVAVICVFMREEESRSDGTTVGVCAIREE